MQFKHHLMAFADKGEGDFLSRVERRQRELVGDFGGQLAVGDYVVTAHGWECSMTAAFPTQEALDQYRKAIRWVDVSA